MNCPVCHRTIASTLSICPSCGTMMRDSVREDLEIKPAVAIKPINLERKRMPSMPNKQNQKKLADLPKPLLTKSRTAELMSRPAAINATKTTVPTLVEFQNKNATLPDWRLKVQNAVRQRMEIYRPEMQEAPPTLYKTQPATSGANALKAEIIEESAPLLHENAQVANALRRIEQSRRAYLVEEAPAAVSVSPQSPHENKNYPFYIAARTAENAIKQPEAKASVNVPPKPKLVSAVRNEKEDFDTNKLPPLPKGARAMATSERPALPVVSDETTDSIVSTETITIKAKEATISESNIAFEENQSEEIEDLAPFSMRFNAGLFDLIIGLFASFILLAPFMLSGGNWLTFTGLLAFLATSSIVMFTYMTTAVGMFGRTLGMRLFSLELLDIEENDYPSFHQAAVSSSVYLLSLVFGGIGFLTIPFNDEKRAVHDIVSGTIVVREY